MVRPDAAARRRRPRPHPGDPPLARRALRPLRVAPHGAAARGGGARQPARREVGAPPQGARAHLPHGEPQGRSLGNWLCRPCLLGHYGGDAIGLWLVLTCMATVQMLLPFIGKTVVDMAEKWVTMADPASGEVEIDVSEWFQIVTEDAITRTAFGRSYEDGKAVFKLQTQLMAFASEAFRKVFIPGYRFLPTKKNTSSWKLDKEIRKNLVTLIGQRQEATDDERLQGCAKDLLGLMINASSNGGRRGQPVSPITVNDIVEECKTFFFAGKQTTSNLLTWTTVVLAMHPEWQDRARQEVLEVCGAHDIPCREQLAKLKTLGMILNETLRLYPPAVATVRRAKSDVVLGGYHIPRDTELLIPIMAVHHDARLWGPDATQFNPARFADGVARAAKHPTAFIPFGLGARMCIGQNLALLEAKLTVAIILQRFEFRLSPKYVHAPTVLMLLHPQYGAPVIFRSRSSSQTPDHHHL
ncbi:hypothetical protein ACQJBY_026191 [Aegilops geniculata]